MNASTINFGHKKYAFSKFNKCYLLNFLEKDEQTTVREVRNTIVDLINSVDIDNYSLRPNLIEVIEICSLRDFNESINKILIDIDECNVFPLIHIEGHGSINGICVGRWSTLEWSDMIQGFRKVTNKSGGSLTVVSAACFSMEIEKNIRFNEKLPFAFYYGFNGEVTSGKLSEKTISLYKYFIKNRLLGNVKIMDSLSENDVFLNFAKNFFRTMSMRKIRDEVKRDRRYQEHGIGHPSRKFIKEIFFELAMAVAEGSLNELMYNSERRVAALESIERHLLKVNPKIR